jgi:TRAP-type C4-dicarboxylate transport system permease small subunit
MGRGGSRDRLAKPAAMALSPKARRAWAVGIVAFFVVLCGMIAWSQWYAIHVNVPKFEHARAGDR